MTKKEWQRHMAYEALVILGMLALLLFVCRLWPILLLVILGIFAAALRLVFLSSPKVQPIRPEQQTAASSAPQRAVESQPAAQNAEDAQSFGDLQTQVTRWVRQEYPNARWVWKYPDSKARFQRGEDVAILLNRAGGYREAVIHLQGTAFRNPVLVRAGGETPAGRTCFPPRGAAHTGRSRVTARAFPAGGLQPRCL